MLQIINKLPITMLLATTLKVPLKRSNYSIDRLTAIDKKEKISKVIINNPRRKCNASVVSKMLFNFISIKRF